MVTLLTQKQSDFYALAISMGLMSEIDLTKYQYSSLANREVKCVRFAYLEEDIFDEVRKRTYYIAKMQAAKDQETRIMELIALTNDDKEIFEPFYQQTTTELLERLAPFTRNINPAYMDRVPSSIELWSSNSSPTFSVGKLIIATPEMVSGGFNSGYVYAVANYEAHLGDTEFWASMNPTITTWGEGNYAINSKAVFEGKIYKCIQAATMIQNPLNAAYWVIDPLFVDISALLPFNIGDIVSSENNVYECIKMNYAIVTSNDLYWKKRDDLIYSTDKLIFFAETYPWMNANSVPTADTNIFEAIVLGIMAKWFVISLPTQAEAYINMFAAKLMQVSGTLNTSSQWKRQYKYP